MCHRLLIQLCESTPSDSQPSKTLLKDQAATVPFEPVDGLTLVLACRNAGRAQEARKKLLKLLDDHIAYLKKSQNYDGHAEVFRRGVKIDFVKCDLGQTGAVFDFCDEVKRK